MTLPRKLISESTREKRFRCPSHLKWVRQHMCCVPGCDRRPIEAAHVRSGTGGGVGLKPDDIWVISLCRDHHTDQHWIGEGAFERKHGISMRALAAEFAAKSPHKGKFPR